MNYYGARQVDPKADRPDAGKWRYTGQNDDRVWPVGPCADGCDGHDSRGDACEHYRQGLLDDANFDGKWADAQHHCQAEGCGVWTDGFAALGPGLMITFDLCDWHRNRDSLDRLFPTVGTSFGSY